MEIMTRKEAIASGAKKYFTGKACPRGHIDFRWTEKANCVRCLREATSAWEKANPEKAKAGAQRRSARRGPRTEYHTSPKRRKANREWYEENKDKRKIAIAAWQAAHPENLTAIKHNYRAKKAAGGKHRPEDIKILFVIQKGKCAHAWCRVRLPKKGYHVDHIIPIALGGSNQKHNLQLLCQPCNSRKSAKHPIDFAQQNGLLL